MGIVNGNKSNFCGFLWNNCIWRWRCYKKITEIICKSGQCNPKDVAKFWWQDFQKTYLNSYGESFELQRILEKKSLIHTLEKFNSSANVNELSNMLFDYWVKPPIFKDSKAFFNMCSLPIYIVSNIDNSDIMQAIKYHSLQPAGVFTSEDAKLISLEKNCLK